MGSTHAMPCHTPLFHSYFHFHEVWLSCFCLFLLWNKQMNITKQTFVLPQTEVHLFKCKLSLNTIKHHHQPAECFNLPLGCCFQNSLAQLLSVLKITTFEEICVISNCSWMNFLSSLWLHESVHWCLKKQHYSSLFCVRAAGLFVCDGLTLQVYSQPIWLWSTPQGLYVLPSITAVKISWDSVVFYWLTVVPFNRNVHFLSRYCSWSLCCSLKWAQTAKLECYIYSLYQQFLLYFFRVSKLIVGTITEIDCEMTKTVGLKECEYSRKQISDFYATAKFSRGLFSAFLYQNFGRPTQA